MDTDDIFFDDALPLPSKHAPCKYTRPADDFRPLLPSTTTLLYLAITTPHTDTYHLHGPTRTFAALIPKIREHCSDSPSALDKLDALQHTPPDVWGERTPRLDFTHTGFTTFVVDGQRGTYTVLRVLALRNAAERCVLPAPMYTVSRHGPLVHTFSGVGGKAKMGPAKGVAATSALVGSYVERDEAMRAARGAMDGLVAGEGEVGRMENWSEDGEGGVVLAMGGGRKWEVRVRYDGEALRRAREEGEGADMGWQV